MSKDGLNKAYQEYVEAAQSNDKKRIESASDHLFKECEVAANFVMRANFGAQKNTLENGPYYDVVVDKFMHFTKPEVIAETRPETFNGLFMMSLKNGMIDKQRSIKRRPAISIDAIVANPEDRNGYDFLQLKAPAKENVADDLRQMIKTTLQDIKSPEILRVYRDYIESVIDSRSELTYEKIGSKHAIPVGTVKSRINNVSSRLRENKELMQNVRELAAEDKAGLHQLLEDIDKLIIEKQNEPAGALTSRTGRKPHFRINPSDDDSPGRF